MRTRRRHERIIRRLEVEFSANDQTHRGISSNFSLGGLFIRTNRAFAPGTEVDLIIHLPDGTDSKATGVVKMAMKTPVVSLKNGMGVEFTVKDENFVNFINKIMTESGTDVNESQADVEKAKPPERPRPMPTPEKPSPESSDFLIVACPQCGAKNKLSISKKEGWFKCGRCGSALKPD